MDAGFDSEASKNSAEKHSTYDLDKKSGTQTIKGGCTNVENRETVRIVEAEDRPRMPARKKVYVRTCSLTKRTKTTMMGRPSCSRNFSPTSRKLAVTNFPTSRCSTLSWTVSVSRKREKGSARTTSMALSSTLSSRRTTRWRTSPADGTETRFPRKSRCTPLLGWVATTGTGGGSRTAIRRLVTSCRVRAAKTRYCGS